jgi:ribosomal protein S18 acetylase RimI-like enzyme
MTNIREGTLSDMPHLEKMLYEAFFWSGEPDHPPLVDVRRRPEFSSLLADWGRAGDVALVAERDGVVAGAVWCRLWTTEAHSYGFVDSETPELGIGVATQFRGRGVGRLLLRSMVTLAAKYSYPAISLSVAPTNPARGLYESEGFRKIGEVGTSWTMLRKLM